MWQKNYGKIKIIARKKKVRKIIINESMKFGSIACKHNNNDDEFDSWRVWKYCIIFKAYWYCLHQMCMGFLCFFSSFSVYFRGRERKGDSD